MFLIIYKFFIISIKFFNVDFFCKVLDFIKCNGLMIMGDRPICKAINGNL